ncbi:hypothetical protein FRC04_006949, partial [Tulasnella sp. 424]
MDELLERFHKLKDEGAFADVRDQFNIPKLHSLLHYTSLICLHGTPDGYNTETPERLHIDYAKSGYRASNKKDYTKQMTTYMSRMEAVTIRREFIKFQQPNSDDDDDDESNSNEGDNAIGESPAEGGDDAMELDETSEEPLEPGESMEPQAVEVRHSVITFAKVPSLPSVPVTVLQQNFGATDFLPTLKQYLREVSHLQPGF